MALQESIQKALGKLIREGVGERVEAEGGAHTICLRKTTSGVRPSQHVQAG